MQVEDHGATVRAWIDVIRRAQLDNLIQGTHPGRYLKGTTVKMVALTLASYADANGRRVFPGVARLAADTGIGYGTAGRCVVGLRELGLIELVRRAVRRGARSERERADEYRLTIPPDLLERITVATPSDFRGIVAKVARPHRTLSRSRSETANLTTHTAVLETAPAAESNPVTGARSAESNPDSGPDLTLTQSPAKVSLDLDTRTTSHPEIKVCDKLAVTRVAGADAQEPILDADSPGPPSLRVVSGRSAGVTSRPPRGLWPAAVPPLDDASPGELARAHIRQVLAQRTRGRASA